MKSDFTPEVHRGGRVPDHGWVTYGEVVGWVQAERVLQSVADDYCDGLQLRPKVVAPSRTNCHETVNEHEYVVNDDKW